ncbi:hypothetical protein BDZ85DRAFT_260307 [Elsinoe ampelina]|uniref:Uncharacterized protein n=1 Tax=Elsinoe ampelina TaxID=302913 RepID=A0A6A6GEC1_9PEZI|nr:hypothetical protein BDZ85DRAFT_260307 [Elsinoe ampelina]
MTPSLNRHNSTGTNSSRYNRSRRDSANSHAAASSASAIISPTDVDLLNNIRQYLQDNGFEDVAGIMVFKRRSINDQEGRSRSHFFGAGICCYCNVSRGYVANMCKHLSDCPLANRHLDRLESSNTRQDLVPGRPRSQTDVRPNRPILPQPPSLVIPDLSTQVTTGRRFPSNQLSPQDAFNNDASRSSFHRTPTGTFHSAPSSQLGDMSDYMQATDSTLSEAPITVGNQDYSDGIPMMNDIGFMAGGDTYEHFIQPQSNQVMSFLDDGVTESSATQDLMGLEQLDPSTGMSQSAWDQWWASNNQFRGQS